MAKPHPIPVPGSRASRSLAFPFLLGLVWCSFALAAERQPEEYEVKAAFLLNFTKFIDWPAPATADSPFTICIFGEDPFGHVLDRMVRGETVGGRKLVVQRIGRHDPAACQILFAGRNEKELPAALADAAAGVLLVGEGEGFLRDGGMIAFIMEDRRVRFDVSQRQALRAGMKISSKLLSVARSVEK
jgi:hypothetical protein